MPSCNSTPLSQPQLSSMTLHSAKSKSVENLLILPLLSLSMFSILRLLCALEKLVFVVFARLRLICFSALLPANFERKVNTGVTGPQMLHVFWDSLGVPDDSDECNRIRGFPDDAACNNDTLTLSHLCLLCKLSSTFESRIKYQLLLPYTAVGWPTNSLILIPSKGASSVPVKGTAAANSPLYSTAATFLGRLHSTLPTTLQCFLLLFLAT